MNYEQFSLNQLTFISIKSILTETLKPQTINILQFSFFYILFIGNILQFNVTIKFEELNH